MRWLGLLLLFAFAACESDIPAVQDGGDCLVGQSWCSGQCVNLQSSPSHCGACNNPCPNGLFCSNGSCQAGCASRLSSCNGACVDLTSDAENCGRCGNACAPHLTCASSTCGCEAGTRECSGACVDPNSDPNHCGRCGNQCETGAPCNNGVCGCVVGLTESACNNDSDDDCDGRVDCADSDCNNATRNCRTSCGTAGTQRCASAAWGTCTSSATEICGNDVDENCDGIVLRMPDMYEARGSFTNNDGRAQRNLTAFPDVDPDDSITATIDSVFDVADCYGFTGEDSSWVPEESILAKLTGIPTGMDLDLFLYRLDGDDATGTATMLASSQRSGNANEQLQWYERSGPDDDGQFMVCVTRVTGFNCSARYTLTIDGLTF